MERERERDKMEGCVKRDLQRVSTRCQYSWRNWSKPGLQANSSYCYIGKYSRITTLYTNYNRHGRSQVVPWLCTILKSP